MKMSRREFLSRSSQVTLFSSLASPLLTRPSESHPQPVVPDYPPGAVPLHFLGQQCSGRSLGTTFGVPWGLGETTKEDKFVIRTTDGQHRVKTSARPLAYWPDGSLKWSAISVGEQINTLLDIKKPIVLTRDSESEATDSIEVKVLEKEIVVKNGLLKAAFETTGNTLLKEIRLGGKLLGSDVVSELIVQDTVTDTNTQNTRQFSWNTDIQTVSVENATETHAVIKVEGIHRQASEVKFPFVVRFYFYQGIASIRIVHTFIYDGHDQLDFIKGLGLSVKLPMGETHSFNRHVRFVEAKGRVFKEAVKGLTGLRRDPGISVRQAQIAGKEITLDQISEPVQRGLPYIPEFGSYRLIQFSDQGYIIQKRTKEGYSWLQSTRGQRSSGLAYLGTPSGGLSFGIKNFWQSYPAELEIADATENEGRLTAWLWSPNAAPMDFRFYHDGMGQDDYEKQWEGLEITYEDYEAGYGTAYGVARTSELTLTIHPQTPTDESLVELATAIQEPLVLLPTPEYLFHKGVFGANWSLPERNHPQRTAIEDQLDKLFDFYYAEVEQRGWYGFWNFGDVMHAYDSDRHTWRYDVGGYAWDNSELSTDLWLWYYFLRTGRYDAFRFAEAMCRHTGEVDVYHKGRFAPLGSRHNVLHWGCSAKQLRISTAANRRIYYYLTGDERTGDLLNEQVEAVQRLETVVPMRKRLKEPVKTDKGKVLLGFGTDWGAVAAAWFTAWERTLDPQYLNRLKRGMDTIAAQPKGFFTGSSYFDYKTGAFDITSSTDVQVSHLSSLFGLVEILQELLETVPHEGFKKAWLDYCCYYNAPTDERSGFLGTNDGRFNLRSSHARLTAYASVQLQDDLLAARAWQEFLEDGAKNHRIQDQDGWREWLGISTNWAAQWSLNAFQCLHYIGRFLE